VNISSFLWDKTKNKGRDVVRDVPVLGDLLGQESSAEIAAGEQTSALNDARAYQERMYGEAKGHLDPYSDIGRSYMDKLNTGIAEGQFLQDDFSYGGSQPTFNYSGTQPDAFNYSGPSMLSKVAYDGSQPDAFNYQGAGQSGSLDYTGQQGFDTGYTGQQAAGMNYTGQQGFDTGYTGGPNQRSIESYMQDDPSLAWQQEQMEKAINRQGAAKGRWGGGATAREMMRETSGLLSQDYANRFNRASMERAADVGSEQEMYGRSLTGLDLRNLAEKSSYDRSSTAFERANLAEESMYNRAGESLDRRNLAEQNAYDRAGSAFERANLAEQSQYNRASDQYKYDTDRENQAYRRAFDNTTMGNLASEQAFNIAKYEDTSARDFENQSYKRAYDNYKSIYDKEQETYNRALGQYGMQGQNLTNQLNQYTGLANMGLNTAQSLANAAVGQGSSMADLAIQQGNVNAAATMADSNQMGKFLDMLSGGLSFGGPQNNQGAK